MSTTELRQIAEEAAEKVRSHLIDIVVRGDRSNTVIEVFVDAEEGITTDSCAAVSRAMSAEIEARGLLPGRYRLDVSSPGIDRPLKFLWQYRKHVGRMMKVTVAGEGGPEVVNGILEGVTQEAVVLKPKGSGDAREIHPASILEARVPAPW